MDPHPQPASKRRSAVLQAIFVTFLWSSSWVLIKFGLQADLPPVTFAGLRYTTAFLCLAPFILLQPEKRAAVKNLQPNQWVQLVLLGIVYYAITQGAQFVSLAYLPAAPVTLLLNLSPILVALLSSVTIREQLSAFQWVGVGVSTIGTIIFFFPVDLPINGMIGLVAAVVAVLANSVSSLMGRKINRQRTLDPLIVTFVSMGIGGVLMLGTGVAVQGLGTLHLQQWIIILVLAIINTGFAFTLWNNTLQTLSAVESSLINNLMLPQIVILAWLFLGESLDVRQIFGLVLVALSTLIVQLRGNKK